MSASLVGSEMCIRDRPTAPQEQNPNLACCKLICNDSPDYGLPGSRSSACLLYTSDAADDM
eukprot:2205902-Alexandrium_andersonii.AAC.1